MTICLDGKWVDREHATVSVYDHGLLYGDGLFEGIRAYHGAIFRRKAHLDRFYDGMKALLLNPRFTRAELEGWLDEAVRREGAREGSDGGCYIRLLLTRGEGPLGIDPFTCSEPRLILIADTIRLYPAKFYEEGIPIVSSAYRRNDADSFDPRIKSLNYLNNIMAKIQAKLAGAQEALMLNHQGYVAECAADNIVVVRNGRLTVPASHHGALEGITLEAVLEIARDFGYPVERGTLTLFDCYRADEMLLTGTGAEIVPVRTVDGRDLGEPGPVFKALLAEFRRRLTEDPLWVRGA